MARHRTHHLLARWLGLVAATAVVLTAGAGLGLPVASAAPTATATATATAPATAADCVDGLVPLADVTVTVNGEAYEAETLAAKWETLATALAPLSDVEVAYDPDDDLGTVDVPADGCSRGFQLEAFSAEGPTWQDSGVQAWEDGAGGTMSADLPSVTLSVTAPACYHQTDLSSQGATFEETDYYDGHDADHQVPSYPDTATPKNMIAAHNGGEGCSGEVVPQQVELLPGCATDGVEVVVALDADLAWSYTLDGGAPVAITTESTVVPIAEDAAYAVVVTATPVGDATVPDGAKTEWTFEGVRDCAPDDSVVVPAAPTAVVDCVEQRGTVVVTVADDGLDWSYSLDGGAPVAIDGVTAAVAVAEDAAYTIVVTAAAADGTVIPDDAQTGWTFEGVRDCGDVEESVVPGPGAAPVPDANAPVGDDDSLARTGLETGPVVLGSLLLLLGGAGLVLLAHRRTAAARNRTA